MISGAGLVAVTARGPARVTKEAEPRGLGDRTILACVVHTRIVVACVVLTRIVVACLMLTRVVLTRIVISAIVSGCVVPGGVGLGVTLAAILRATVADL